MLSKPELATDEHFLTNADRVTRRDEITPLLNQAFCINNRDEWWEMLGGHGFPCGPVRDVKESLSAIKLKLEGCLSNSISLFVATLLFRHTQLR